MSTGVIQSKADGLSFSWAENCVSYMFVYLKVYAEQFEEPEDIDQSEVAKNLEMGFIIFWVLQQNEIWHSKDLKLLKFQGFTVNFGYDIIRNNKGGDCYGGSSPICLEHRFVRENRRCDWAGNNGWFLQDIYLANAVDKFGGRTDAE